MTITIHYWHVLAFISAVLLAFSYYIGKDNGDWDFITPVISAAIVVCVVVLWVGFLVGSCAR